MRLASIEKNITYKQTKFLDFSLSGIEFVPVSCWSILDATRDSPLLYNATNICLCKFLAFRSQTFPIYSLFGVSCWGPLKSWFGTCPYRMSITRLGHGLVRKGFRARHQPGPGATHMLRALLRLWCPRWLLACRCLMYMCMCTCCLYTHIYIYIYILYIYVYIVSVVTPRTPLLQYLFNCFPSMLGNARLFRLILSATHIPPCRLSRLVNVWISNAFFNRWRRL